MKMRIGVLALLACGAVAVPALAQDFPSPEQILSQIDTNMDGGIDRAEWAASPAPVPFPEEADTSKDGKIDLPELTALFAQFQGGGAPPPPPPAAPAPQG